MKLDCTDPEKLEALLAAFTEYAGTHEHELQDACDALLRAEEKDLGGGAAPVQGGGGLSGVLVVDAPEPGAGAAEGASPAEDPGSPGPGSAAGAACPSASAGRRLVERLGESLPLCPIQHWKAHKRRPPGASSAPSVTDPSAGGGGPGAEEPPAAQVLRQLRALRAGGGAGGVCALHLAGSGSGDGFVLDWTCDALAVAEPSEEAAELLRRCRRVGRALVWALLPAGPSRGAWPSSATGIPSSRAQRAARSASRAATLKRSASWP